MRKIIKYYAINTTVAYNYIAEIKLIVRLESQKY